MLKDRNSFLELEGQLSNTESYSAPKLTSLLTTSSAKIEMRDIKEIIFNHAKELHYLYQRSDDLSTEQLEAISKGLSCILDLGEPEKEGTLRCLFSDDLRTKLIAKYTNRFKTTPSVIDTSLIDKWSYIINLYNHQNGVHKKTYLWACRLYSIFNTIKVKLVYSKISRSNDWLKKRLQFHEHKKQPISIFGNHGYFLY